MPVHKGIGKWELWPSTKSKPLKIIKFKRYTRNYVPLKNVHANFRFDRFSGGSPQMGEMLRFCDFFVVLYCIILFSCTRPARTRGRIFTTHSSNDVFLPKEVRFGGIDYIELRLGGQRPPNPPKVGVVRQFQAKTTKYGSVDISEKAKQDQLEI